MPSTASNGTFHVKHSHPGPLLATCGERAKETAHRCLGVRQRSRTRGQSHANRGARGRMSPGLFGRARLSVGTLAELARPARKSLAWAIRSPREEVGKSSSQGELARRPNTRPTTHQSGPMWTQLRSEERNRGGVPSIAATRDHCMGARSPEQGRGHRPFDGARPGTGGRTVTRHGPASPSELPLDHRGTARRRKGPDPHREERKWWAEIKPRRVPVLVRPGTMIQFVPTNDLRRTRPCRCSKNPDLRPSSEYATEGHHGPSPGALG